MKMIVDIKKLVREEYERAIREHGYAISDYEALALLQEKIWEAETEMQAVRIYENLLKEQVYTDLDECVEEYIGEMKASAINAACELIQVAAMCDKFKESREVRESEAKA